MREITFTTIGLPAPQGSKNKWGGEDNKRVKPWRDAIAADAAEIMEEKAYSLFTGAIEISGEMWFPRPKSHYRTGKHAHELRESAPTYVKTKPDLDKLQRAIGDALTGVVFRDDSQVAAWAVCKKYGEPVFATLTVKEIEP